MPTRDAVWVLAFVVGINFLNYLDRWVGSAVVPLIQAKFNPSHFSVDLLGSALTLVYALGALPFGLWADRGIRRTVIGTGVAIWSVATLITCLTPNFAPALRSVSSDMTGWTSNGRIARKPRLRPG